MPPSVDRVHKTRTTVRRLLAALYLAKHSQKSHSFSKLRKNLRKLFKAFSDRRDLDVAMEKSKSFHQTIPDCDRKLSKINKKLERTLKSIRLKKLLKHAGITVDRIKKHPRLDLDAGFAALEAKVKPWITRHAVTDSERHQLRLKSKRLRDSLELVDSRQQSLIELQKHLGEARDLMLFQKLAAHPHPIEKKKILEIKMADKLSSTALKRSLSVLDKRWAKI